MEKATGFSIWLSLQPSTDASFISSITKNTHGPPFSPHITLFSLPLLQTFGTYEKESLEKISPQKHFEVKLTKLEVGSSYWRR
jgi:hypothetical protein